MIYVPLLGVLGSHSLKDFMIIVISRLFPHFIVGVDQKVEEFHHFFKMAQLDVEQLLILLLLDLPV
jgi:hypothetical protein